MNKGLKKVFCTRCGQLGESYINNTHEFICDLPNCKTPEKKQMEIKEKIVEKYTRGFKNGLC